MTKEIIDCIPSKTMREYLYERPLNLSILQQATIVSEYATKKQKIAIFEGLLERTDIDKERLLLETAIEEIRKYGYPDKRTNEVYDKYFPHTEFPPFYPFVEVCNLPVLFEKGEVIRAQDEYFYIASLPELNDKSDFTDECYLCYSLNDQIKDKDDLFSAHRHIHVCVAEKSSSNELNAAGQRAKTTVIRFLGLQS